MADSFYKPLRDPDPAELYDTATEVYEAGDYDKASEMFQALDEAAPSPHTAQMAERARAQMPGRDAAVRFASSRQGAEPVALPELSIGLGRDYDASDAPAYNEHPQPTTRARTGSRTEHRWTDRPEAADVDPIHMQTAPDDAPNISPEARANMAQTIRNMPGTHTGNEEMGTTQTPYPTLGLAQAGPGAEQFTQPAEMPTGGGMAEWDDTQRATTPTPIADRYRAEPTPDQEQAIAGATPDAQQRQPGHLGAQPTQGKQAGNLQRERFQAALEATQGNRRKNRIIAAIAQMLGARPGSTAAIMAGSDDPMRDFEAWRGNEDGLRARADASKEEGRQRGAQSRRDDIAERRLSLAERVAGQNAQRADRRTDLAEETDARRAEFDRIRIDAAQGDVAAEQRMRDPESDVAAAYRTQILREAQTRGVDVTAESLVGMSAEEMDEAYGSTLLRSFGHRRSSGRRGGGGGGGGRGETREQMESLYAQQLQRRGLSEEEATQRASVLDSRQLRSELAMGGRGSGRGAGSHVGGGPSPIPGWEPTPETPNLRAVELSNLRQASAAHRSLNAHIARMIQLAEEVSAAERAGNRAVVTARMEDARGTHEFIVNGLREVGHYGVPQEAELARMEALAPRLTSADGLVNATRAYSGLRTSFDRQMGAYMESYGFVRGAGGGHAASSGGPSGGGTSYLVTFRGRQRRMSEEQLQQLRDAAGDEPIEARRLGNGR